MTTATTYAFCKKCEQSKPLTDFSIKRGRYTNKCKECHNKYQRIYFAENPEKYEAHKAGMEKHRPKARAAIYGLTVEEMQEGLDGLCQLCEQNTAKVVDHDHDTGQFRGFLCGNCNTGLGKLGDSLDGLRRAMLYLENSGTRLAGSQK